MVTPAGTPPFPSPIVQPPSSAQSESLTPTVKHAPKSQSVIPSLDLGPPRVNTDVLKRPRTASVSGKAFNADERKSSITLKAAPKATESQDRGEPSTGALPRPASTPRHGSMEMDDLRIEVEQSGGGAGGSRAASMLATEEAQALARAHPSVRELLATINSAVTQARSHPDHGRVTNFLSSFLKSTDIHRALTTGADDAVRSDPDVRRGLDGARDVLAYMSAVFDQYKSNLPPKARRRLELDIKEAGAFHKTMERDSTWQFRTAVLGSNRVVSNFLLLFSPIVEGQKKTTALYSGSTSKSTLRSVGLGRRKTTHFKQFKDHFIGRDLINDWQGIAFGVGAIHKWLKPGPLKEGWSTVAHHPAFTSLVGVGSVITAAMAFHGPEIKGLLNKMYYGEWEPHLKGIKQGSFGEVAVQRALELGNSLMRGDLPGAWNAAAKGRWHRQAPTIQLPAEVRQALEHIFDISKIASGHVEVEPGRKKPGIGHLRNEMEEKIGTLSDSANWTMGSLERSFDTIHQDLATLLAEPDPPSKSNQDLAQKVLILGLGAAALLAPVYFLKDNPIGFVDLLANAAFVTGVLAMIAANPNSNVREASDTFGSMCGFSLAMLPVWGTNLGLGDPMEESWKGMLIGAAALMLIGNTITAPLGAYAGKGAAFLAGQRGLSATEANQPPNIDNSQIRELPEDFDEAAFLEAFNAKKDPA